MDLSPYRKMITLMVTAALVFGLQQFGLTVHDLPTYGLELAGVREAIVDYVIQVGLPGVFMLAQPNEKGDSLWRHWRWLVVGLGIVVLIIGLVLLL